MRPLLLILFAVVPAPNPTPPNLGAPSPGLALTPAPAPTPGPALAADPADSSANAKQLFALVQDATRWFIGPPDGGKATTLPAADLADAIKAIEQARAAGHLGGAPAFGGGWAVGVMIDPERHPDAREYPLGMVITPPNIRDHMVIPLGCDGLVPPEDSGWAQLIADLTRSLVGGCPKVI
jgi:hypothetical protein